MLRDHILSIMEEALFGLTPSTTKIRFQYPEKDDISAVKPEDIVLVFQQKPTVESDRPKSRRLASTLKFEDKRLEKFNPIY